MLQNYFVRTLALDQVKLIPFPVFLPRDEKNAANRLDRAAFAPDEAPHIALGNANLKSHVLAIGNFSDLDCVGLADQRFYDCFDRLFHRFLFVHSWQDLKPRMHE